MAVPLRVQRAVARFRAKDFSNEDWAVRSAPFSDLARECHAAYGAPDWCARPSSDGERGSESSSCLQWHKEKLQAAFRNAGAPWYGGTSPDALTVSGIIHFGYEGGRSTRTHLVPLDRAPEDLPRAEFGSCHIGSFSEAELTDILKAAALERHGRGPLDIGKFSQFKWLLVNEPVEVQPAAQRDIRTWLLDATWEGFGLIDIYPRRFPAIVERALSTLLLHSWEDSACGANYDTWKPFDVPWVYMVNNDPFEAPRRVSNFTSLSWEPYLTPDDDDIEHDQPARRQFEEAVFDGFETKCRQAWVNLQSLHPLDQTSCAAFNPLIEHFLLCAYWEDGIDELVMHMTMLDAAIGKQERDSTKAIARWLGRLLSDQDAETEFKRLYDLRCAYIHGRGKESTIPVSDLVAARRLARRTAEGVLRYAKDHPSMTRDHMLDHLDGKQ